MARANVIRLVAIYALVHDRPGLTVKQVAEGIGVSYYNVRNCLPTLEGAGLLLSEDERGRLFVFEDEGGVPIRGGRGSEA